MKDKDIKKHKKTLLIISTKITDFASEVALHAIAKRGTLPDICKVTEDIFEVVSKDIKG